MHVCSLFVLFYCCCIYFVFSHRALFGGWVLEVMDFVEHDGQPVELGDGVDAVGEHGLPDDHHLHPTGVQLGLNFLHGVVQPIPERRGGGRREGACGIQFPLALCCKKGGRFALKHHV